MPGTIITNYGPPANITYLITEQNGQVNFVPANIYIPHLQSATLTEPGLVGVATSYGGVFCTNYTSTDVPVTIFAVGLPLQYYSPQTGWVPFQTGLYYFPPGTYLTLVTPHRASWYVNGTQVTGLNGDKTAVIYINGPTTITLIRDYYVSVSASPHGAGKVSPKSGWYPAGTVITFNETPTSSKYQFAGWTGTYTSYSQSFNATVTRDITEIANYFRV